MPLCEIRVPTYRRPDWLRRALESLRAQSHRDWRALVFDDSPDREGAAVVESFGDDRIRYHPNSIRLGAAGNIDQAFSPEPLAGGQLAMILEDDAALRPTCLADNLRVIEAVGVDLILRNQAIYEERPTGWQDTGETTRGIWLEPGCHPAPAVHALLFFLEGVSNGGLFWRLGAGVNLRVGPQVTDAGLQECCRTLLVRQPLCFAPEPLVIFTRLPADRIQRTVTANRTFARGVDALRRHVLRSEGDAALAAAETLARRVQRTDALARVLLELGVRRSTLPTPLPRAAFSRLKAMLRTILVANPVAGFLPALPQAAP